LLKYYRPNGPYIAQNSANYPTLMNVELAMRNVIQAGINRCARTQSHSLVATGRWPNCVGKKTGCLLNGSGLIPEGSGRAVSYLTLNIWRQAKPGGFCDFDTQSFSGGKEANDDDTLLQ
jgi:hypothetical protein